MEIFLSQDRPILGNLFRENLASKPDRDLTSPVHLNPTKSSRTAVRRTIKQITRVSQGDDRGRPNLMNLSESLVDEIRGKAYLIGHDDDIEGRRESVRMMLRVTAEQRSAGLSEAELRALFEESMWTDLRKLDVDPFSLKAETILAVGTRMIDACLNATRWMSIPA